MSQIFRVLVLAEGVDRSEAAIFAGLRESGLELRVGHEPEIADISREKLAAAGIPTFEIKARSRVDRAVIQTIRRELTEAPYDLVYAPINRTLSAALFATRGLEIPVIGYRGTTGHLSRLDPACWLTYFNPRLSHIICVSDAVRDYLLSRGLPPSRLTRIYKGHDPAWYAPREPDPPLPEMAPESFKICFAGRVRPVKGVKYLLDALQLIPPEEPVELLLAGSIDERAVLDRLKQSGCAHKVHALGHRRDATAIIGKSDLLVMPSVAREGLPRAVVEAMSQSLPVVASGVGGLPEIVLHGETGLIVPPRDANSLAEAIRGLRDDPELRRRMGAAGRSRVDRVLHIRHTVQAFEEVFRDVAGKQKAG